MDPEYEKYTFKFCANKNDVWFLLKPKGKRKEITMIMSKLLPFADFSFRNYKDKSLN